LGNVVGKEPCPRCVARGNDSSGDNLIRYDDDSAYCFACGHTILSEEYRNDFNWEEVERGMMSKTPLTKEERDELLEATGTQGQDSRGLTDKTYRYFAVRFGYDDNGNVDSHYYPVTDEKGDTTAFKVRYLPKTFSWIGKGGKDSQLFGQWKHTKSNAGGKYVVIASGECFPPEVEVMTEKGFVRFDQLEKGVKVLQVNEDFTSEFVEPLAYIEKDYDGILNRVDSAKVNYLATPNHNMIYVDNKNNLIKKPLKENISARYKAKLSTTYSGSGTGLEKDQIALILAVCADSKIDYRKNGEIFCHFGFRKERKITRLTGILNRLGVDYRTYNNVYSDGKNYTTFNFTLPKYIKDKRIPKSWIKDATLEEKNFILEELLYWDGNISNDYIEFSSKHYEECSTIYELCVTSGRYSYLRKRSNALGEWYCVHVYNRELEGGFQRQKRSDVHYKGKVYCVTVPTGMIQVRINGRSVVVGNCDAMSAHQMLEDYRISRNSDFAPIPVVSSVVGETASYKQIQAQYEWLNRYDQIILIPDQDDAGQEAVEAISKVVPKNKLRICSLPEKDCNDMLTKGKHKQFIQAFYDAKMHVPVGVKTAADAFDSIPEELKMQRITLPSYMKRLQEMMGGGIKQGRILNVIADTSVGKTTHVRRMVYHWIFNSPVIPTIVSLEDTSGQYMLDLIGLHLEINMQWSWTEDQILDWLETEDGQRVKNEVCYKEDGTPRFFIIDERGGSISHIEEQMEMMYRMYDSRLFVIDVLTDLLRGSNSDLAEDHMNFQKGFIKEGATIVNVHHTRKPMPDKEGKLRKVTEYDALGTGSFVQSGAYNIVLNRDKLAESPQVRNTTEVDMPKCRGGKTGSAGGWYYEFDTVTCHDLDEWLTSNT
jgi:archaellum biogenesis ATPase FlaH